MGQRSRYRRAARRVLAGIAIALVALTGAAIGWALAPASHAQVGPLSVRIETVVFGEHPAVIDLPPVGEVAFDTHAGPLGVRASVESVDAAGAQEVLGSSSGLTELADTAPDAVRGGVLRAFAWSAACSVVAAGLATAVVYRRRRRGMQGAAVTAAPLVVLALVAAFTFDPAALEQPQFTGLLTKAPYLAGEGRAVVDRLESYRSGVADMVRSVTTLYTATDELPVLDRGGEVTTVLHLSDIHLNPQGLDLAEQLVDQFGVDAVVDTGDITTWGSDAESATLARIGRIGVPYVFVRGNHDSQATAAVVAAQPNGVVLDGTTAEVAGLVFAGVGDARFSPDGGAGLEEGDGGEEAIDDGKREAARGSAEELADLVGVTDRAGDDVDVALIHDPSALDALFGTVPLVLAGHYHRRIVRLDESGTWVMVQGSSGGAGFSAGALESLEQGEPLPLSASLLYFAASGEREGELVAYDEVTVGGLGLSSVSIDRVVVPEDGEAGSETDTGAARNPPSVTPDP
jgi:predicted MPP superfamily phosphohydrolase